MSIRPRRSVLYMPGSNARALEKAKSLEADALILDLEDAVAPEAKELARDQVVAAVKTGGFGRREVIIRINGPDTPWHEADLAAAISAAPDALLLPKISSPEMLVRVGARLAGNAPQMQVWAMVETPAAILSINAIAAASQNPSTRLACLVMGTNDLAKESLARFVPGRAPFLAWLSLSVAAARAHGLGIIDGVFNDLQNEAGFRAECEQGRDFGFDGKTLIHPGQISVANAVFSPSQAEVDAARTIIAAFALPENHGKGAISLNGRMVERLHADMAERVIALAEAVAES